MKYNERIRELREDNYLTQQKVADYLHIGQRTYADYESGKTRIPVDNLILLAQLIYISVYSKIFTHSIISKINYFFAFLIICYTI